MSILVDDRAGSKELFRYLNQDLAILTRLEFGDLMFGGNGPGGQTVSIGIEHKTIGDLLSCIDNGRFAGTQLPGLLHEYEYVYLMVEGIWRGDPESGVLQGWHKGKWTSIQYGKRAWTYHEVESWLNTMSVICGVIVIRTSTKQESAQAVQSLYGWWGKKWANHKSHMAADRSGHRSKKDVVLTPVSRMRQIAMDLPGIGWGRSAAVEAHFPNIRAMVNADVKEWMKIDGIGKVTANQIVEELG